MVFLFNYVEGDILIEMRIISIDIVMPIKVLMQTMLTSRT